MERGAAYHVGELVTNRVKALTQIISLLYITHLTNFSSRFLQCFLQRGRADLFNFSLDLSCGDHRHPLRHLPA